MIYHLVKSRLKTMYFRPIYEHNEILEYFDLKKTWTHGSMFFLAGGIIFNKIIIPPSTEIK